MAEWDSLVNKTNTFDITLMGIDEAVNLTSEKHDPYARTVTYKRRKQEHLVEGAGVEPAKYLPKVKLDIYSHNSRVLEKGLLCVP